MSPSKYILTPPEDLHPYDPSEVRSAEEGTLARDPLYPDFRRWRHTKEEDQVFLSFVSKGYYATSNVNFESISARSSLPQSLPKIADQLGAQFSSVLRIREDEINRVPAQQCNKVYELAGPGFALPARVTLTDNRREAWLHDLSLPYVSLHSVSKYIPHGLKRKRVIEQCYTKQIPLKRALWLIKCCCVIEMQQLKTKHSHSQSQTGMGVSGRAQTPPGSSPSSAASPLANPQGSSPQLHLLKEWTDSFIAILEKLVFEMSQYYNDAEKLKVWKTEIAYFLKLLGNCYTADLLDRDVFHRWLVEFVARVETFEFLPITLHILVVFWDNVTSPRESTGVARSGANGSNFLLSKITDMLLHKYYVVSNAKSMINDERYIINDIKKNNKLKESILAILTNLIIRLFKEQSLEIFLFPPSSWELYKPCLYEIINKSQFIENVDEIRKILELISYRNETLKDTALVSRGDNTSSRESTPDSDVYFQISQGYPDIKVIKINHVDTSFTTLLDDNNTEFDWTQYIEHNPLSKSAIVQLLLWSVHPSRSAHYESNQLVAKLLLLQINSFDGFPEYEIEDTVWLLIFQIAKIDSENLKNLIDVNALYLLLNILVTYGNIKVSTYIRKLISSGIMYLPDSNDKYFHVMLLINLKISPLMKNQYNMVLRNVMEFDPSFYENYNYDKFVMAVDDIKEKIAETSTSDKQVIDSTQFSNMNLPLGGKIMLAEWFLTRICSRMPLQPVNRETLLNNFRFLCVDLNIAHHFYKWVEFVVYHQLLADIDTMALLIDILICYQKLFSQYINDHVLFMKTFLFIYDKVLRETDSTNFQIVSFMPFWKFFMKNFPMALIIDNDLRNGLSAIYEEEKTKSVALEQNKTQTQQLFSDITGDRSLANNLNFAELFQSNIKSILQYKTESSPEDFKKAKRVLSLLKASSLRDYNKFMSVFLKRKNYSDTDLVCLISNKLLSVEQIKSTLGMSRVMPLLVAVEQCMSDLGLMAHSHFINTIYYRYYMIEYVRSNYRHILESCNLDDQEEYQLFLRVLIKCGPSSKFASVTTNVIVDLLQKSNLHQERILHDLLQLHVIGTELPPIDPESIEHGSLFALLDFTNLWIFQAYMLFQIGEIRKQHSEYADTLEGYIGHVLDATGHDELCSKLFDRVSDIDVISTIVEIYERNLFARILDPQSQPVQYSYLVIAIETVISLSRKVTEVSPVALPMPESGLDLLFSIVAHFNGLSESQLLEQECVVDVVLKIFTIHQEHILHGIVAQLQNPQLKDRATSFIRDMLSLFDKLSFSLRLKLSLYEVLSSLKSYSMYVASGAAASPPGLGPTTTVSTSQPSPLAGRSQMSLDIPKELQRLPPLQVSSFVTSPAASTDTATAAHKPLGLSPMSQSNETDDGVVHNGPEQQRWFLYNRKSHSYTAPLRTPAYYHINNYQTSATGPDAINNACYNLALFNASFENKNPA